MSWLALDRIAPKEVPASRQQACSTGGCTAILKTDKNSTVIDLVMEGGERSNIFSQIWQHRRTSAVMHDGAALVGG